MSTSASYLMHEGAEKMATDKAFFRELPSTEYSLPLWRSSDAKKKNEQKEIQFMNIENDYQHLIPANILCSIAILKMFIVLCTMLEWSLITFFYIQKSRTDLFSIYLPLNVCLSFIFISTIPLKVVIFQMVFLFSVSLTSANLVMPHFFLFYTHIAKRDPQKWKLFLLQSFCSNNFSKTFTWSNFK